MVYSDTIITHKAATHGCASPTAPRDHSRPSGSMSSARMAFIFMQMSL